MGLEWLSNGSRVVIEWFSGGFQKVQKRSAASVLKGTSWSETVLRYYVQLISNVETDVW